MAPPLFEQVLSAIGTYAVEEGRLAALFAAHGLSWDEADATEVLETAAMQIAARAESRGEAADILDVSEAATVGAVQTHLERIVAKRAGKARARGK